MPVCVCEGKTCLCVCDKFTYVLTGEIATMFLALSAVNYKFVGRNFFQFIDYNCLAVPL